MPANQIVDVLIIGGGPAGLSCALALNRILVTNIVFDDGVYRNRLSKHMHTVPGWDHCDPADFRAAVRKEISGRYGATQFQDIKIDTIKKLEDATFEATDANGGNWLGKKVVLATGVSDVMLDIEGYEECWVTNIFHCLFCHGYESRAGPSAGILAIGLMANVPPLLHVCGMATRLADQITIYTNGSGDLASQVTEALPSLNCASKVHVDSRVITRFEKGTHGSDVMMHFSDGSTKKESFLTHSPSSRINGPWQEQLGLELLESGDFKAQNMFNESSVGGVCVAGDCASMMKSVSMAVLMGGAAAAGLAGQLVRR